MPTEPFLITNYNNNRYGIFGDGYYANGNISLGTAFYSNGWKNITLPWNINYLSTNDNPDIKVNSAGYISFGTQGGNQNQLATYPPPYDRLYITPNGNLAILELRYAIFGIAPNRVAYIKYTGVTGDIGYSENFSIWEVSFPENNPNQININIIQQCGFSEDIYPGVYKYSDTIRPSYYFPGEGDSATAVKITKLNPLSNPYYEWKFNGVTSTPSIIGDDYYGVYPYPSYLQNRVDTVTVYMRQGSSTGTIVAADTVNIYSQLKNSGIWSVWLTNPYVTIPTNAAGEVIDFTLTKGQINKYSGTSESPWSGTTTIISNTNCTATVDYLGNYQLTSMTADTATVTFRVQLSNYNYSTNSYDPDSIFDLTLTVVKSKIGNNSWNTSSIYGGNNGYAVNLYVYNRYVSGSYKYEYAYGSIQGITGFNFSTKAISVPAMKVESATPGTLNTDTKKFFVNANTGVMLIGDANVPTGTTNNEAAAVSPIGYERELYFHSLLNYLQIRSSIEASNLYFPVVAASSQSLLTVAFQTVAYGSTSISSPLLMIRINGVGYPTGYRIEYASGYRNFYATIDSNNNISIECHAVSYNSALPAVTLDTVEVLIAS
jgi:hypothetical protein